MSEFTKSLVSGTGPVKNYLTIKFYKDKITKKNIIFVCFWLLFYLFIFFFFVKIPTPSDYFSEHFFFINYSCFEINTNKNTKEEDEKKKKYL